MDRVSFDETMNGVFAAFQKPAPRQAVLDEAYKPVEDLPDEFILWAAGKLKEEEKLPLNLGRELKRLWPAFKAETTPVEQYNPYANEQAGDPNCPDCRGRGWLYVWPTDPERYKPGCAEYAIPCLCNTVVDSWEHPPRKASLADLKATGKWTMRRPPMVRNAPPQPMGFSLDDLFARLREGRTWQEIADSLGRSKGACANHASEILRGKIPRATEGRGRFDPWRPEEDQQLCRAYLPGGPTIAEVAKRIGRSEGACLMRAKSLGISASKPGPQRRHELAGSRRCHDCGRPTNDFRCYRCRIAWREKHGVQRDATEEEGL